jgi:hypothetical protein
MKRRINNESLAPRTKLVREITSNTKEEEQGHNPRERFDIGDDNRNDNRESSNLVCKGLRVV